MIPYIFLAGFLGSGKTTLLNVLLDKYKRKKVGVIVNDFGEMGIDTALINAQGIAGDVQELKAGQIFCSCLSSSFVESILKYQQINPDLLIVECSGLAKPASLKDITKGIDLKAPGRFTCGGMICLVDGERHIDLEDCLMVLTEQIESSDLLMVTKTDLLSESKKKKLLNHLSVRYPEKRVLIAPHGKFEGDLFALLTEETGAYTRVDTNRFDGWGEKGRPLTFVITPQNDTAQGIRNRIAPFLSRLYRIKGVVQSSDKGMVFFDGTSAGIKMTPPPGEMAPGLVVITHDPGLEFELNFI